MNLAFIGMAAALGLSAAGSAFGAGFAGMSSVGAWKKCYASVNFSSFFGQKHITAGKMWIAKVKTCNATEFLPKMLRNLKFLLC